MTTPAVARFVDTNGDQFTHYFDGSSAPVTSIYRSTDCEVRPESAPAGRLGRFKLCADWYHNMILYDIQQSVIRWGSDSQNQNVTSGCVWSGPLRVAPIMPDSNMINACLIKALNKLKKQDVHAGNFVAEFHQVISMFTGHVTNIANQVKRFRARWPKDFAAAKRLMTGDLRRFKWCEIPNRWLELQYGWKPLMSDIYGGMQHLAKRAEKNSTLNVTVRSFHEDVVYDQNLFSGAGLMTLEAHWLNQRKVNIFLVYAKTDVVLAELSSLGLINPAEIVWETTRFSFVVDWFVPVSNWLSAVTADTGFEFISGGQAVKSKRIFNRSTLHSMGSTPIFYYGSLQVRGRAEYYTRTCYAGTPFPGLYVKNPLSFEHAANALALLAQAFR